MSMIRVARMAEEMRAQISEIVQHHLSDPRLSWVSVVRVDMSPDLHYAKVYISVMGSEAAQEQSLRVLSRARGAVRAELGRRLRMRKIPEITFLADHSIAYGVRIQAILHELGFTEEGTAPGTNEAPGGAGVEEED